MTPHVEVVDTFAMVPEALVYDTGVSAAAVRVYAALHRHGSDPSNCYPSLGRLAGLLGTSRTSVKRWLGELEAAGWVERVARFSDRGDQAANGYRLLARKLVDTDAPTAGCSADAPPRSTDDPGGGVTGGPTPGPDLDPQKKESHKNESQKNETRGAARPRQPSPRRASEPSGFTSYPTDFEAWWAEYPRKRAKGDAASAYRRALGHASQRQIIDGLRRSIEAWDRERRPPDKVPYPATWLNGRCWDDEHDDVADPAGTAYATDPNLTDASARGGSQWA